jgi:acyl-CoA thioester hydrolase
MRQSLIPSRNPSDYPFSHRIRTRFAETDAMGVIHHAAYFPYLEEARVAYLRHVGHPYDEVREDGIEMPVLEVALQYRAPLHFNDEVDISLRAGGVTRATFQIAYLLQVGGDTRATGVTVHGCVDQQGRASRLPSWVGELFAG